MARYIVLPGRKTFGGNAPGTILELTDAEYSGLDHLLQLAPDDVDAPSAPAGGAESHDSNSAGTSTPAKATGRRKSG